MSMSLLYLRWGSVARDPRTFSPGPGCCLGEWLDGIGEPVRVHDEVEQLNADEPDIRVLVVLDPVELGLELLKAEEGGERRPDRVGELEAEGVLLGVVGVGVIGSSTIVVVFLQDVKNSTKRSVPQSILFIFDY